MKIKSTIFLLLAVCGLGAYIVLVDAKRDSTDDQIEKMNNAFQIRRGEVSGFSIRTGDYAVGVVYTNNNWRLLDDSGYGVNLQTLNQIVSRLSQIQLGSINTPADLRERNQTLADYGLQLSQATIAIRTRAGERLYHVGNPNPTKDLIYIKERNTQAIMAVSSDLLEVLPQDPTVFRDRRILGYDPTQVERIELISGESAIRLDRAKSGWWTIAEPLSVAADQKQSNLLMQKLSTMRISTFVDEALADEVTGLDATAISIRIGIRDRAESIQIDIGKTLPDTPGEVYARFHGSESVFTLSKGALFLASHDLSDLRDRRLFHQPVAAVDHIRLSEGEDEVELVKKEDGWWVNSEPAVKAADARVAMMLRWFDAARVETFQPHQANNDLFIRIELADSNSGQSESIRVLRQKTETGRSLVVREDNPSESLITTVDELKYLQALTLDYRSRAIFAFKPERVVRLELRSAVATNSWVKVSQDGWKPVGDEDAGALDPASLAAYLSNLEAAHLIAETAADPGVYGLDNPVAQISVGLGGENPESRTLLLGRRTGKAVYAQVLGRELVFQIPLGILDELADWLGKSQSSEENDDSPELPE